MVKGYKVFRSDWTCEGKQYICPGIFQEDVNLKLCHYGMHFCKIANDCFGYYDFDPKNHVAEVIAHGNVVESSYDSKCCTDKLEIVREISWEEVLQIVNLGTNCVGIGNVGRNNVGDWNVGNFNEGNFNVFNHNIGDYNIGERNLGNRNIGNNNIGDFNIGGFNSGNHNIGKHNNGNYNLGNWNKSSFTFGCFCTEEQKIMLFNKPSNWSYYDWVRSGANYILHNIKREVELIYSASMTDQEKEEHPMYEITGGYVKDCRLEEEKNIQLLWDKLPKSSQKLVTSLPNFDPDIFYECTGIRVNN
jgi:hypothetical protein